MSRKQIFLVIFLAALIVLILLVIQEVSAGGVLDDVSNTFKSQSQAWAAPMVNAAKKMFWVLAAISCVWTFFPQLFRSPDVGSAFGEILRFVAFIGFFYWILDNGVDFAETIIKGMTKIGKDVGNIEYTSPSSIVDMGKMVLDKALEKEIEIFNLGEGIIRIILGGGVFIVCTICAIKVLLEYIACWILAYAGIFFLGFGATKWTSDMAIGYFKTVLGTATSLMAMYLLLGVANKIFEAALKTAGAEGNAFNIDEILAALVISICLLALVGKVPGMLQSITSGGGGGGSAWASFGAGAAFSQAASAIRSAAKTLSTTASVTKTAGANAVGAGLFAAALVKSGKDAYQGIQTRLGGISSGSTEAAAGSPNREQEMNEKLTSNPDSVNKASTGQQKASANSSGTPGAGDNTAEAKGKTGSSGNENAGGESAPDSTADVSSGQAERQKTEGDSVQSAMGTNAVSNPHLAGNAGSATSDTDKSKLSKAGEAIRKFGQNSFMGRAARNMTGAGHVTDPDQPLTLKVETLDAIFQEYANIMQANAAAAQAGATVAGTTSAGNSGTQSQATVQSPQNVQAGQQNAQAMQNGQSAQNARSANTSTLGRTTGSGSAFGRFARNSAVRTAATLGGIGAAVGTGVGSLLSTAFTRPNAENLLDQNLIHQFAEKMAQVHPNVGSAGTPNSTQAAAQPQNQAQTTSNTASQPQQQTNQQPTGQQSGSKAKGQESPESANSPEAKKNDTVSSTQTRANETRHINEKDPGQTTVDEKLNIKKAPDNKGDGLREPTVRRGDLRDTTRGARRESTTRENRGF